MDSSALSNRPSESAPTPGVPKSQESLKDNREINEVTQSVGGSEYMETVEGSVDVAAEVSETMKSRVSEDKKGSGARAQDDGKGGAQTFDPAQIKAQLLKNIPSEPLMRKQIEKEIRKEIKYLHKKAIRMMTSSRGMSYFEMNNLMKKIRELKGLLLQLVKASVDSLKTLWLRFVHGVL